MATPIIASEVDFSPEGAGKRCKTWYTIFGTFPSLTGVPPLVCIHGGPGVPHNFLRSIGNLSNVSDIPVIMYDQIGCGRSTHLPEKRGDIDFWTMELFLSELDNLLSHLGIQDNYSIFGQSWGGMVAAEHAILHPKGLRKLIISNASASERLIIESVTGLLKKNFPLDVQNTLLKHEADGTIDDPEYQQAKMLFYSQVLCRVNPLPADMMASIVSSSQDTTVNHTINGPYVFKRTGSFRDWSIEDRSYKIRAPTLLINGKYDGAQDIVMEPFFNTIEKVKWVRFGESSHTPFLEEPEEFLKVVNGFLSLKLSMP